MGPRGRCGHKGRIKQRKQRVSADVAIDAGAGHSGKLHEMLASGEETPPTLQGRAARTLTQCFSISPSGRADDVKPFHSQVTCARETRW